MVLKRLNVTQNGQLDSKKRQMCRKPQRNELVILNQCKQNMNIVC